MIPTGQINTLDPNSLAQLKRLAHDNSPEALRGAAQQFEALFLQMVLKSMRDATPQDGLFDNEQTKMYQSLLDQQLAMNMARSRGTGLADALVRQLGGAKAVPGAADEAATASGLVGVIRRPATAAALQSLPETAAAPTARRPAASSADELDAAAAAAASAGTAPAADATAWTPPADANEFVNRLWPHAVAASRETGIPARFLIAHAALETGWGKRELRHHDGRPSFNLFNIKAGRSWSGDSVATTTKEYAGGRAHAEHARFRSYGSYAEAFRDYARLLAANPRYANVVGRQDAAGFARGLQQAGYATDPMYADKIVRIIGGRTLRTALAGTDDTVA